MVSFITTDGCPELPSDSDTVVSGSDVKAVLCELPADTLEDIQTSDISSICTEASKDSTIPPLVAAADDRSFDASSAEDSFMPRRKENKRTASIDCNDCWEFLDDVSVAPTATETDESAGASIVSYGEELSQHDFSLGSVSSITSDQSPINAVLCVSDQPSHQYTD